jgi:hypothetical protein
MRQDFQANMIEPLRRVAGHLKFIDVGDPDLGKSGAPLGLTRLFGGGAPGERVTEATPGYSGQYYTVVAKLGLTEVSATWVLEGSMTREEFETYVD